MGIVACGALLVAAAACARRLPAGDLIKPAHAVVTREQALRLAAKALGAPPQSATGYAVVDGGGADTWMILDAKDPAQARRSVMVDRRTGAVRVGFYEAVDIEDDGK